MDTAHAPPGSSVAALDPFPRPAPRRRGVRVVVAILAVIAVGLGTAIAWASRYDPLTGGSSTFRPSVDVAPVGRDVSYGGGPVSTAWFIGPTAGEPFTYAFSIRNDGPLAVTVTAIGASPDEQRGGLIRRRVIEVEVDPYGPDGGTRLVPFRAFTLEPGGEANVWMEAVIRRCQRDATVSWSTEPVTFRVAGAITRHVEFTPQSAIVVRPGRCEQN